VIAGLVAGAAGGLLLQRQAEAPVSLSGASPAFAGEPAGVAGPVLAQAGAPVAPSQPSRAGKGIASKSSAAAHPGRATLDRRAIADPVDRLSQYAREPYYYASLGRRDPFASLVKGDFMADGDAGLVDVGNMKLVGIAWDEIDRFAMVEDGRGFGYVLREGDAVRGGKVFKIERESVTFVQTTAGVSSTITIDLPIREAK
jgi:hypothetical protein